MNEKLIRIKTISNRLARSIGVLVCIAIPAMIFTFNNPGSSIISTPMAVFVVGITGGFVGLQRRLKQMSDNDLELLANSWVYIFLSPLVGGVLAIVTYLLFISGLLQGDLFPTIVPDLVDEGATAPKGFAKLFAVHGEAPADYGKILFWAFIAGFSERFATDIISRFESQAAPKSTDSDPS